MKPKQDSTNKNITKLMDVSTSSGLSRAKAGQPCICCGSETKGCSLTPDGLALCRGTPQEGWHKTGTHENGFSYYRADVAHSSPRRSIRPRNCTLSLDWSQIAEQYARALTDQQRGVLAKALNLPIEALAFLPQVGFREKPSPAFTFPECNGKGNVVGIVLRSPAGKKWAIKGSKRGLTIPSLWDTGSGPLLFPEGASDVLAIRQAEVSCIGRPSDRAGVAFAAEFLRNWPIDRAIIIVGENDQKADGSWPGRAGAEYFATNLAVMLNRPVLWSLPHEGYKDSRHWLISLQGINAWSEKGSFYTDYLLQNAITVKPAGKAFSGGGGGGGHDFVRRQIIVGTDEHRVTDEAIAALANDPGIFHRAGMLVQVVANETDMKQVSVRRANNHPFIRELPQATLRESLTKHADWKMQKPTGITSIHPPQWCVQQVLARGHWPQLRYLNSVINHPIVLPNGRLITTSGYEADAQLYLDIPESLTVDVPKDPSKDDVIQARNTLVDIVNDFPFKTKAHISAWISALLTPLARFSFDGPAPLFLIDANTRGAGKGLLADAISLILTGDKFPVMTYSHEVAEMRKIITSLAAEGERLVLLDNIIGPFGNSALDAALTSTHWKDRYLGINRLYEGPLHLTWYVTGNNVQLFGDTSRRVMHIHLQTLLEKPELREGLKYPQLRQFVSTYRRLLLSAALTILRGWFAAGSPDYRLSPWGSFEGWTHVVRNSLVHADMIDPGETRAAMQSFSDRSAEMLDALLFNLESLFPKRHIFSASEVLKVANSISPTQQQTALLESVKELLPEPNATNLGCLFRDNQERIFGGLRLVKHGTVQGIVRWSIDRVHNRSNDHIDVHHPHDVHSMQCHQDDAA